MVGYTAACNSLPLGCTVYIENYGYYTICDRGGMDGGTIDLYYGDYDACIAFGVRQANVYLVN